MSTQAGERMVEALERGVFRTLKPSHASVYSFFVLSCADGPRVFSVSMVARPCGLSERAVGPAIDALCSRGLVKLTPLKSEHRHRLTGRYELVPFAD